MRSDRERLKDIQEAITKIEKYTQLGKPKFLENELIQSWVLLQLQIIGEAARAMTAEIHRSYPAIEWRDLIDFRNLLVHEYFRVDLEIVWQIVEHQIPLLKTQINTMLNP